MAIQLTPEQEQRIQAVVNPGAYPSAEEALDAALAAVETAATPGFEGTQEELETLLLEGLNSGEPIDGNDAFWNRLRSETDRMAAEHQARKWFVKVELFPRAEADIIRQFRYYLVDHDAPITAFRFRDAVKQSLDQLKAYPRIGSMFSGFDSGPSLVAGDRL
jgi:plasmid stabilization system protein ParE/Arc/MetJ-type ribon-helix-helix transcriptional regulator